MSSNQKIRTAVVGLKMGRAHAHAYKEAERSDLRWVVDIDEERAATVASEVGCQYTTDYESILDDIDAISVCLPHHLHAPVSLKALEAGKHVLVEKPMANTEAECLAMIDAADRQGVKLMVAFPLRYREAYVALKEAVDSGEYGDVIVANGFVHGRLTPAPGTWFSRKDQLGGGVLFSHGCHDLDIMIWLLGMPLQAYSVSTRVGTEWMEGEGTSQCVMEFEGGALGNLSVSWGLPFKDQRSRIQVHTTKAMLAVTGSKLIIRDQDGERALYEPPAGSERTPGTGVIGEIEHFLDCIIEDKEPLTNGHEAMKSLRVVWDLYRREEERAQGTATA